MNIQKKIFKNTIKQLEQPQKVQEFVIPDNKQLGKIALTVLAFSVVTSLLIAGKWPTE